ncbi:MAG: porphobilinogen synthase, partial [Bacteroidetes bacterium]|nr:porphobilinogen synthase [Bacteroidota bacterium]
MNIHRPRRNRKSQAIRDMVEETSLSVKDFVYPLFLTEGENKKVEISSMPGMYRFSIDNLLKEIGQSMELGIPAFALFPQIEESRKDKYAKESYREGNLYLRAIAQVKKEFPVACIITDVAMDPYSSD